MSGLKDKVLYYKKLTSNAMDPVRATELSAGLDIKSAYEVVIPPVGKALIETDIQVKIPNGCYGRLAPRSSLASRHYLDIGAGVIDSDYRGSLKVLVFNHHDQEFKVERGMKIAQLICEKIMIPTVEELPMNSVWDDTKRNEGGFGSSDEPSRKIIKLELNNCNCFTG